MKNQKLLSALQICLILSSLLLLLGCPQGNNKPGGKTEDLAKLNVLGEITIHGMPVRDSKVDIPSDKNKIEKINVGLKFKEEDAPDFTITPNTAILQNEGDTVIITLSTPKTEKYKAWERTVTVRRKKSTEPKTFEECIATLTSQLDWSGKTLEWPITTPEDKINLPVTVAGFAGSSVTWSSSRPLSCTDVGVIGRELIDIEVELTATVTWNGKTEEKKYKVIVGRIKVIEDASTTTVQKYDFTTEGTLVYWADNKVECKYSYDKASVKIDAHSITLKLNEVTAPTHQSATGLISVEQYVKDRKNLEDPAFIEAVIGAKYQALDGKSAISWEELKNYVKAVFIFSTPENELTDEKIFEMLKNNTPPFKGFNYDEGLGTFKIIADSQRAGYVQNLLDKTKEEIAKKYGLSDALNAEKLCVAIKTKLQAIINYYVDKVGRAKIYSYNLEKSNDSTKYPSGYKFFAQTVYQKDKTYLEQNGEYEFAGDDRVKHVMLFIKDKNTDGSYNVELLAKTDSIDTGKSFAGRLNNNEITATCKEDSSTLNAKIKDKPETESFTLEVTTPDSFKNEYEYRFFPSIIGQF